MKEKFSSFVSESGKNAKDLFKKTKDVTKQLLDQNDDGKLDKEDISIVAEKIGGFVKDKTTAMMETAEEKLREIEVNNLNPIFPDTIADGIFRLSKFIRVTERSGKYINSESAQGSIGRISNYKDYRIVTIFRDSLEYFNIRLLPNSSSEFYYMDPLENGDYIALDEYFSYIKVEKVNELQVLAQDLGAKHFKVTFKEEKTSLTTKKASGNINIHQIGTGNAGHSSSDKEFSEARIEAENHFPGHSPIEPSLKYLANDPTIKSLIKMRMNPDSPLQKQSILIHLSSSSILKVSDAIKIDAFLKGLKLGGNTSVESEAQNESKRYLEYEIEF